MAHKKKIYSKVKPLRVKQYFPKEVPSEQKEAQEFMNILNVF